MNELRQLFRRFSMATTGVGLRCPKSTQMTDQTNALAFKRVFEMLASEEPLDREKLAQEIWYLSGCFDLSPFQMECSEALQKLGLFKRMI